MENLADKTDALHVEGGKAAMKEVDQTPFVPDVEAERRLVRKLDRTILPWIMLLYLLLYIDRSNMGNARNIGLEEDLALTGPQYQLASATFYIGTVVFGTVGGLMLKVIKPSTWLGICAILWGAASSLQASCTSAAGLAASELCVRIAAYAGISALSGVISGLVAYGIGLANNMAVTPWQALFMIEGLPTILVGALTLWILPDRPESAKSHWFTEEEYEIILSRRNRYTRNKDDGISLAQVKAAFRDFRLYLFVFIYSGLSLSLAVAAVFLPTIIKDLGYHSVTANLMTAPVYAVAYCTPLITATFSDRFRMRGVPISIGGIAAGTGYILLGTLRNETSRYVACFFAISGTYMAFPIVLTWITSTFATAISAILMSILLYRENRKRDRRYGKPEVGAPVDIGGSADNVPNYRYEI